jgi:hypothetical protein
MFKTQYLLPQQSPSDPSSSISRDYYLFLKGGGGCPRQSSVQLNRFKVLASWEQGIAFIRNNSLERNVLFRNPEIGRM